MASRLERYEHISNRVLINRLKQDLRQLTYRKFVRCPARREVSGVAWRFRPTEAVQAAIDPACVPWKRQARIVPSNRFRGVPAPEPVYPCNSRKAGTAEPLRPVRV